MGTLACFAGCPLAEVGILSPLRGGRAMQAFGMLLGEAGSCHAAAVPELSQVGLVLLCSEAPALSGSIRAKKGEGFGTARAPSRSCCGGKHLVLLGVLAASASASPSVLLCCCRWLCPLGAGVPGTTVGISQQWEHP